MLVAKHLSRLHVRGGDTEASSHESGKSKRTLVPGQDRPSSQNHQHTLSCRHYPDPRPAFSVQAQTFSQGKVSRNHAHSISHGYAGGSLTLPSPPTTWKGFLVTPSRPSSRPRKGGSPTLSWVWVYQGRAPPSYSKKNHQRKRFQLWLYKRVV